MIYTQTNLLIVLSLWLELKKLLENINKIISRPSIFFGIVIKLNTTIQTLRISTQHSTYSLSLKLNRVEIALT
jgi:hypothetical protein